MRFLMPVFVIAFVPAVPVLLVCAVVLRDLDRRRLRSAARAQSCPSCGGPLGLEALQAGDESWHAHVAELRRAHPGVRLRLVRLVNGICPACGVRLHFRRDSGIFSQIDPVDRVNLA